MKLRITFNNHDIDAEIICEYIYQDEYGYLVTQDKFRNINGMFYMNEINSFTISETDIKK